MISHLRANLFLIVSTLLLCSIVYPLIVWTAGFAFPSQATGGIVTNAAGKPVGALLIAQEFKGDEYFQPRPSATSPAYNASASSGQNWGANNPKLRDRVARQLGPIVQRKGQPIGPEVEKWFNDKPDRLAVWAKRYPTLANAWINADQTTTDAVKKWLEEHDQLVSAWKEQQTDATDDETFFAVFGAKNLGKVPSLVEKKIAAADGADVQGWFFDMWLQEHPEAAAELDPVPADMVTTSASGLDPHITYRNAHYQLPRVAKAWAEKKKLDEHTVEMKITLLLNETAFTPLLGFGGERLVNVFKLNLALQKEFGTTAK
jgi:potassium-transporting ATPase KdpC subunit